MLRLIQALFFKIFTLILRLSTLPNKTRKGILLLPQRLRLLGDRHRRPIQLIDRSTNVLLIDRLHLTQVMQIGQAIDLSALVQSGIPTDRGELCQPR
jgi:hypothetical protein